MHIVACVGVEPVRSGQGSFAPDQRLTKYQGKHGLTDSFFQTTVDNAIKWWAENKNKYQDAQGATLSLRIPGIVRVGPCVSCIYRIDFIDTGVPYVFVFALTAGPVS